MLMTTASDEKRRRRVERCCVELGNGLYNRRSSLLSSLVVVMMIGAVVLWYFFGRPTVYNHLIEKTSKEGWGALSTGMPVMLLFMGKPLLLPLVYLLLRWGCVSSASLRNVVNAAPFVLLLAGSVFPFFLRGPVSETAAPWIIGTFFALFLVLSLLMVLYESLARLLQRRGVVDGPLFRALSIIGLGVEPLVRVDGQTLTLSLPGNTVLSAQPMRAPLANLRGVTISTSQPLFAKSKTSPSPRKKQTPFLERTVGPRTDILELEYTDGSTKTLSQWYSSPVRARVIEFLQRKLPASVKLTVEER